MWKKMIQIITGKDCDLRERMLRTIILVGGIAVIVACVEIFIVMKVTNILLPILLLLLLAMGTGFVITFKYHKYDLASVLIGIVIIVLVMPLMFLLSESINAGADVWLSLGIMYIFIMFTGKRMVFFLALTFFTYFMTYQVAYMRPDLVALMPNSMLKHVDSFFSVFAVGLISGIILKLHMKVYEAEHELNLLQKEELERTGKSKNAFFANMSHEIRTPINAIIGLNEMILRSNPTGETREYAQDIQMASKMLLNQVNDILDLSQMEMEKMKIIPNQYQTKELFLNLVELVRIPLEKKKLQLNIDIDPNLPSVLYGDEKRLKQVLLNILDNAVKYTDEGSVTLSAIGEDYHNDEITLKIKIADTGIGIRKEDLAGIYDAFNRFDELKNKRILGTGLGLAITKQLMDLMEGEITVDSIYRKGTIFTIVIKQKIVNPEPVGEVNHLNKIVEEGDVYRPLFEAPEARILIVDDSKMNRMVASRLLGATKMQIDEAGSGAECLEMTKHKFYHAILVDYMMPDMNGDETLKAIHTQENGLCKNSAVIALTGNTVSGARQLYLESGFDGYVEKPIQGRVLETEILGFLPEDIIEYQEDNSIYAQNVGQMERLTQRKRKKVYITTDCTCDIPPELIEKYDIKLMYLYIKTPYGRFADTREIDSDSIPQYISLENSTAFGDRVSVEEFEEFFAEALTQAEQVVHISLASKCGKSHGVAVTAAEGFDHVRVVDSGQISCGQALVVLHAAKLAMEGKTAEQICEEVNKMKNYVHTRFIMPSADIFYHNGRTRKITAKACRILSLHPFAGIRQKKAVLVGLLGGSLENAWKQGVFWSLRSSRKINTDIIYISHVGCSVKQLEILTKEVSKYVSFKKIIIQKASFTTACNVGMETIGFSYYTVPVGRK